MNNEISPPRCENAAWVSDEAMTTGSPMPFVVTLYWSLEHNRRWGYSVHARDKDLQKK